MSQIQISDELFVKFNSCSNIKEDWRKRIAIASVISEIFKFNDLSSPILVGGSAVAVYTDGQYATMDIDMISNVDKLPYDILLSLGYKKRGKDYYHEKLMSLIEFPSGHLNGDESKVRSYLVNETGYEVNVIGIEDLILDRMDSFNATNDESSKEWAMNLMGGMYQFLDWSYLHSESHRRKTYPKFEKLQRTVKRILKEINENKTP